MELSQQTGHKGVNSWYNRLHAVAAVSFRLGLVTTESFDRARRQVEAGGEVAEVDGGHGEVDAHAIVAVPLLTSNVHALACLKED